MSLKAKRMQQDLDTIPRAKKQTTQTNLNFSKLSQDVICYILLFLPATPYAFRYQSVNKYFHRVLNEAVEKGLFTYWIVTRNTPERYRKFAKTVELADYFYGPTAVFANAEFVALHTYQHFCVDTDISLRFPVAKVVAGTDNIRLPDGTMLQYFSQSKVNQAALKQHIKYFGRSHIELPNKSQNTVVYGILLYLVRKGFCLRKYCLECLQFKKYFWRKSTTFAFKVFAKAQNYYVGSALFTKEQVYLYCVMETFAEQDVQRLKHVVQNDIYFDRKGLAELCKPFPGKCRMLQEAEIELDIDISLTSALLTAEHLIPIAMKKGNIVR